MHRCGYQAPKALLTARWCVRALADGESTLTGALDSEDTQVMVDSLDRLGIAVHRTDGGQTLQVQGGGGQIPALEAELYVGNSGTTIRFLTALATLGRGAYRLDGVPRMRERPIGDLLDALNQLGAHTLSELDNGCPPVIVHANGLPGGSARVKGNISSQFLSGLLMVCPCAQSAVELEVVGATRLHPVRVDDPGRDGNIWGLMRGGRAIEGLSLRRPAVLRGSRVLRGARRLGGRLFLGSRGGDGRAGHCGRAFPR